LGVGTGEAMNETAVQSIDWPGFRERFQRLREAVDLIRCLWSEERVTFEGDFYRTRAVTVYDRPDTAIPVYVAAGGRTMAKFAGEIADGMICTSGKGHSLYAETLLPGLAEGIGIRGRQAEDVERMIEVKVSFDEDSERAVQDTRFWAPLALSPEEKAGIEDPAELAALGDALPIERVASRWIVSSDVEEHIERISEYVRMGFNHLVFHSPGTDQKRFLSSYERIVLPELRRRSAG